MAQAFDIDLCMKVVLTPSGRLTARSKAHQSSGTKAGELPTHFHISVNPKTARALGATILDQILVRADKVIA